MTIIIDKIINPEYPEGKSYYVKLYSKMIVANIPELTKIYIYNVPSILGFSKDDRDRFIGVQNEVKSWLIEKGLIKNVYGNLYQLVVNAKEMLNELDNPKDKPLHHTTNIFATNSNIIHDSRVSDSQITNNVTEQPAKKDAKSIWFKIFDILTNNKLISSIIFAVLTALAVYFKVINK